MKQIALVMLLLTGCATTAPNQTHRPAASDTAYTIGGSYNEITGKVHITVDGNPAINGQMPLLIGDSTRFTGTYAGMSIESHCHTRKTFFNTNVECMVLLDNQRAATLTF